jgi:outer membrane protein TolC
MLSEVMNCTIRNILGTSAKGYLVGAQLSWNVFDGYKSIGKFEKAKAEFQKAKLETEQYKKQSQLELNKTNRQLKDAENKVNLSQLAFEQSQEAYRIRQNQIHTRIRKNNRFIAIRNPNDSKRIRAFAISFRV